MNVPFMYYNFESLSNKFPTIFFYDFFIFHYPGYIIFFSEKGNLKISDS